MCPVQTVTYVSGRTQDLASSPAPPDFPQSPERPHLIDLKTPTPIRQGTRAPIGTRKEVSSYELSNRIEILWLEDGLESRKRISGITVRSICGPSPPKCAPGRIGSCDRALMKIAALSIDNVNKRLPHLLDWLDTASPDVVCLQEPKAEDHLFPADAAPAWIRLR